MNQILNFIVCCCFLICGCSPESNKTISSPGSPKRTDPTTIPELPDIPREDPQKPDEDLVPPAAPNPNENKDKVPPTPSPSENEEERKYQWFTIILDKECDYDDVLTSCMKIAMKLKKRTKSSFWINDVYIDRQELGMNFYTEESYGTERNILKNQKDFSNGYIIKFKFSNDCKIERLVHLLSNHEYLISVDMTYLDISFVKEMRGLFFNCKKLKIVKGIKNISKVTDMMIMFADCPNLEYVEHIEEWGATIEQKNVSTDSMFENCDKLKKPSWYH